jgi:hypothetical protein
MLQRGSRYLLCALAALVGSISVACTSAPTPEISLDDADVGAARFAKHLVIPLYPVSSVRAGREGLAVIGITVNEKGSVVSVSVLQAPDQEISSMCFGAAKASTFSLPGTAKARYAGHGKLYYYFRLAPTPHVDIPGFTLK